MVFPLHNWLVLIRILEKVNKIRIAFSFCSKQTESNKCHNHMETLREPEYRCGIARAELPGNSSLRHWCLLLSTVATFFRPSMTANLFSLNLSSVFDQAWVGSRLDLIWTDWTGFDLDWSDWIYSGLDLIWIDWTGFDLDWSHWIWCGLVGLDLIWTGRTGFILDWLDWIWSELTGLDLIWTGWTGFDQDWLDWIWCGLVGLDVMWTGWTGFHLDWLDWI